MTNSILEIPEVPATRVVGNTTLWQHVQVLGNGCTHYRLTQHWVNLKISESDVLVILWISPPLLSSCSACCTGGFSARSVVVRWNVNTLPCLLYFTIFLDLIVVAVDRVVSRIMIQLLACDFVTGGREHGQWMWDSCWGDPMWLMGRWNLRTNLSWGTQGQTR